MREGNLGQNSMGVYIKSSLFNQNRGNGKKKNSDSKYHGGGGG